MRKFLRFLSCVFLCLIGGKAAAQSPFPYYESFMFSKAPDIEFGGAPKAFLTAGTPMFEGEGQGFLRLTENAQNQKGYVFSKTKFPSGQGLSIEFEYFSYGSSNADGICFFLFDASVQPTIGGFGGSLGYAPYSGQGVTELAPGLKGAYLGVGLDEYGNFATNHEGRLTGINEGDRVMQTVTLRGAEPDYKFLFSQSTNQLNPAFSIEAGSGAQHRILDTNDNRYRKAYINLEPRGNGAGYDITVKIKQGGGTNRLYTVINKYPYTQSAPSELSYGFAGATGGQTNNHEIRNLRINYFTALPPVPPTAVNDISKTQPVNVYHHTANQVDVLKNDKKGDYDLNPATVEVMAQPLHAIEPPSIDPSTGKIIYKPDPTFTGLDSLKYVVKDLQNFTSNIATVYLNIKPKPKGSDDATTILMNTRLTAFDLTSNDLDKANGTDFILVQVSPFQHAKVASPTFISPDGKLHYEPEQDYWGKDSATYVIRNKEDVDSDPIWIRIKVNSPPVAVDNPYHISRDEIVFVNIVADDKDAENELDENILTLTGGKGNIIENIGNGMLKYQPAVGFTGTDELFYTVKDKDGAVSNIGKVKFTIYPIPVIGLAKKLISTTEAPNNSFDLAFSFVVKNYEEVPLSKVQVTDDLLAVFSGTTFNVKPGTLKATGTLKVNPAFDGKSEKELLNSANSTLDKFESGTIEFVVNVRKPASYTSPYQNTALVKGTFSATGKEVDDVSTDGTVPDIGIPNRPWVSSAPTAVALPDPVKPTASPFTKTIYVDSPPILIDVLEGDAASLPKVLDRSSIAITQPAAGGGSAVIEPSQNYQLTYTPPTTHGTYIFSYTVKDDYGVVSNPAEIKIIVKPLPVGIDDLVPLIHENTSIPLFNVKTNDPDGAGAKAVQLSQPTYGTAVITEDGTLTYINTSYNRTDQLTYRLETPDGGKSLPITVNLIINKLPVGTDKSVNTSVNVPITIDLSTLALDMDGTIATMEIPIGGEPRNGRASSIGNGLFRYIPDNNYVGTDKFTYIVKDNDGGVSLPKTITIVIADVQNAPPLGQDKTIRILVNSTGVLIDILSLTTDPDGNIDNQSLTLNLPPLLNGTWIPQGNGIYKYVPNAGFVGTVPPITYTIKDTRGAESLPKTITIIVENEPAPRIGLAKALSSVSRALNGSYDIKYLFTLKNIGTRGLENVSLKDDLGLSFSGADFMVRNISASGSLVMNNSFNGLGNIELLNPSSKLAAGETASLELTINVKLNTREGVFLNTAFARAVSSSGELTEDQSTSGLKPDPFVAGDVTPRDPTIVELLFPELFIPEGFSPNSDGTNDVFVIRNAKGRQIEIEIFNRWGNRVYRSSAYQNDWDGKCYEKLCLGQDLPTGTYYYLIRLGGTDNFKGFITLNR